MEVFGKVTRAQKGFARGYPKWRVAVATDPRLNDLDGRSSPARAAIDRGELTIEYVRGTECDAVVRKRSIMQRMSAYT